MLNDVGIHPCVHTRKKAHPYFSQFPTLNGTTIVILFIFCSKSFVLPPMRCTHDCSLQASKWFMRQMGWVVIVYTIFLLTSFLKYSHSKLIFYADFSSEIKRQCSTVCLDSSYNTIETVIHLNKTQWNSSSGRLKVEINVAWNWMIGQAGEAYSEMVSFNTVEG